MGYLVVPVLVLLALGSALGKNHYDPMVVFVCGRGAMHMDPERGWYSDSNADCLESKDDILNYCKSVYPSLDVTNIVETADHQVIKGWCPVGQSNCRAPETFKVRPYRCLTGAFQSDALIVPHGCAFDHVHDAKQCKDYAWWADVASKSCVQLHQMTKDSHAMLLPCGTDLFTGVEFVCCPEGAKTEPESKNSDQELTHPKIEVKVSSGSQSSDSKPAEDDVVRKYLDMQASPSYDNEHSVYELAKKQLTKVNHEKITKLMKEWAEAKNRLVNLKAIDPNQASKLNEEITDRYQKEYFALQTEGDSKALQIDAVHQQHVQSNFNNKKRIIMQEFMDELQAKYYNVQQLVALLQKYIATEQRDAKHCLKHFLKIRDRDPQAAQDLLPATVEHMTLISTRINQSIELLDTIDDETVVEKMKLSVRNWLRKSYISLDKTVAEIKGLTAPVKPKDKKVTKISADASTESHEVSDDDEKNMYKIYAQKLSESDYMKKARVKVASKKPVVKMHRIQPAAEVDHLRVSENQVDAAVQGAPPSVKSVNGSSLSAGAAIAIACSLIGAMMIVVISILLVKKRNSKSGRSHTYLQVAADAPAISPEDRHIAAMQNGYENPTYKLLEQRKV